MLQSKIVDSGTCANLQGFSRGVYLVAVEALLQDVEFRLAAALRLEISYFKAAAKGFWVAVLVSIGEI